MNVIGQGRFVKPDIVVTHFHLREGDRVADFGAGAGYFSRVLSRAVGKNGKVYACEIQRGLVEKIGNLKREEMLSNLEPLWTDLEAPNGTKLPDATLDAGVIVNTLFQIENKEAALKEIARVLRPGGKLFVIDWTDSFGGMGPTNDTVLTKEAAQTLLGEIGFEKEREFDAGEHHYGLAYRKV